MAVTEAPPFVPDEAAATTGGGVCRTVWLRGEHDIATDPALADGLTRLISLDDADLVLDFSMVDFIGASTVGVIVRAHGLLRARSRSLTIRSPSPTARRLFALCRLSHLIEPGDDALTAIG